MVDQSFSSLRHYQAYIVRVWLEAHSGQWRLLLLDSGSGERWIFDQFQDLADHLQQRATNES